ncbi:Na+/H+ antiporter subunit A [Corynebacterium caspium]|uniref:Na+/H+ antiporter subunit A n=1 Tax=Corynebacterium caspium TaxID=234828 RepID=UPI0003672D50|nr:Na+/H+ antiporter subunit A [Corynebacterium caspium]WKD58680.1 Na(+)/H(+) antiporter subunit A [Corynebacterium caspium DSM 44850]
MLFLLCALAVTAALAPFLLRLLGKAAFALLALVPAGGFIWVVKHFLAGDFSNNKALNSHYEWLPMVHLDLTFQMDALSAIFSLIVLGIGTLVLLYCWGYFDSNPIRLSIFAAQMVSFAMVMFGLVISDSLLLMYIFWELTSVLSFLLVGYYGERASSRRSATQALLITTLGGLSMLVGIIMLGRFANIWHFTDISTYAQTYGIANIPHIGIATALLLAGALSKSAIAPAHFWLPGAMAAPTPVSAYLHSAAMVKAGIYLVARLAPNFQAVTTWYLILIVLGVGTMVLSGWVALRQKDLKLMLAYGTVSQLGFIMSVMAVGSPTAIQAGLALTLGHALFKATLFMVIGAIDHATGTRHVNKLSGLWRKQPFLFGIAIIAAASMSGIPPLFGFVAKESALQAILEEPQLRGVPGHLMITGLVLGSILTMAYSCYVLYGAFATKPATHPTGGGISAAVAKMHRIGPTLWLSPAVLTVLTVSLGIWPRPADAIINTYLQTLKYSAAPGKLPGSLALWHGLSPALALSAVIIAVGTLVFLRRETLLKFQLEEPALGDANTAYDATLHFFRTVALRLTASTQRGSLVVNLSIIFFVLMTLPLSALILGERPEVVMMLWENPWQAVAAGIMIVIAIVATRSTNRLSGVILVGVTGYGMATLFVMHGAPDLALTQVLVETIQMVIFMLVLRKLPSNTEWRGTPKGNRARAWLAAGVGISVSVVALFAMNSRTTQPISRYIPDLAYDIGHGANAVNVLLVDIRGWDTLGEISVLVLAATGVASLIYGTRSFTRSSRRPTLKAAGRRWLAADVDTEKAQNRSLMIDVITRLSFPTMIALSIYFFFAGHNAPGGGFAGGLVAALAFSLRYIAGGREELEEALPVDAGRILGTGLLIAVGTAAAPMFFGRAPLTSHVWEASLPLVGSFSIPSAIFFDLGVYLIVIGLIMHILTSLGGQVDADEAKRRQLARDRARTMSRTTQERRNAARAAARARQAAAADGGGGGAGAAGGSAAGGDAAFTPASPAPTATPATSATTAPQKER